MSTYFINMPDDAGKKYHQFTYPAGEVQVRLLEDQIPLVRESRTIVMTANITDGNSMPMVMLCRCSNESKRFNRAYGTNPPVPAIHHERIADLLLEIATVCPFRRSTIPWMVDEVVTFDVHSPVAAERSRCLKNVGAESVSLESWRAVPDKPTILLPDKGSLTRYNTSPIQRIQHRPVR